ncbi:MAG: restriction endonuclease subunit S [Bacteroidetes bacterium]|nr:restriction endonuclease subunit S [Bacteroidota bacterium]
MSNWKETYLKDISEVITKGTTPTSVGGAFTSSGINFIKSESLNYEGIIDDSKFVFIDEESNKKLKRSVLKENDILFSIAGIYLGKLGIVKKEYLPANTNQACAIIRLNHGIVDYRFIKQLFAEKSFINYINSLTAQSAQPNINLTDIGNLKLLIPTLDIQQRIASILSAYDDLIEVNNQRIKLLEETAQQLYKEWFVRMRFPNYKKTKFEKGIPKSWKVERLDKHISIVRGKSYTSEEIDDNKGDYPFINLKNIKRGGGFRLDGTKFFTGKFKKEQIVLPGDIVMAVTDMTQDRLIVGRVARVPLTEFKEYVISLDISKIVSLSLPNDYIYSALRFNYYGESLAEFANGTNVLHLNPELLKKESILIPDEHLINDFVLKVKPMYELMDVLAIQNEQLRQIRDRLLPRLISGKLQVKEQKALKKTELVNKING